MIKLYYSAGSCSTSCHISLEESGLKYEAIEVDFDNANDPNVDLVSKLNPLGTLPIFITEDGRQLDQNLAIHQYIADKAPLKNLLPKQDSFERVEAMNWMSFVAADLHKAIAGMFSIQRISEDKAIQDAVRKYMLANAQTHLQYFETKMTGKDYILGKNFSVVDAYAYIVIGWSKWLEISLDAYPSVQAYMKRVTDRPAVAHVLKVEDLL